MRGPSAEPVVAGSVKSCRTTLNTVHKMKHCHRSRHVEKLKSDVSLNISVRGGKNEQGAQVHTREPRRAQNTSSPVLASALYERGEVNGQLHAICSSVLYLSPRVNGGLSDHIVKCSKKGDST